MGNVVVITFDGSEEVVEKILAVLKEENGEEITCDRFVIKSTQDISINAKEKTVYLNQVKVNLNGLYKS